MANPPEVALAKLAESLHLLDGALRCLNELRRSSTSPELRTAVEQLRQVVDSLDGLRIDIKQAVQQKCERKQS